MFQEGLYTMHYDIRLLMHPIVTGVVICRRIVS